MKTVAVIGEGAWGTAIATVLAHNGHRVNLWCHDPEIAKSITTTHLNPRYMPNLTLATTIYAYTSLHQTLENADYIFEALPVQFLRSILQTIKNEVSQQQCWVVLSKGIEQETLLLPTALIDDALEFKAQSVVLAGPTFAHELARKQFSCAVLAAKNDRLVAEVRQLLTTDFFRFSPSNDTTGVQLCGALKNCVALAAGMLEGAGFGTNTQAAFMTSALQEMRTIITSFAGKEETVFGLAGVGDVVLTTYGTLSKNKKVGTLFGAGQSLETILKQTGFVPEGVNSCLAIKELVVKHQIHAPLFTLIAEILSGKNSVLELVRSIARE